MQVYLLKEHSENAGRFTCRRSTVKEQVRMQVYLLKEHSENAGLPVEGAQ